MKRAFCFLFMVASFCLYAEGKEFFAFTLNREAFLYRRPLLASGPSEEMKAPLTKKTELLILYKTKKQDWAYVRSRKGQEGWVPKDWIKKEYLIDESVVRKEFIPIKVIEKKIQEYEWKSDVDVWGDELLLEALENKGATEKDAN